MEDNNVKEEGPTPPKVNKGGRSPLVTHNSFKYSQLHIFYRC